MGVLFSPQKKLGVGSTYNVYVLLSLLVLFIP
jgi:hypothetical protein